MNDKKDVNIVEMRKEMSIVFLGGVFAPENEAEIIAHSKKPVEFSANNMQKKLISALKKEGSLEVLSAPFIGSYPNQSSIKYFNGFSADQELCKYIPFNNLWGYRNLSRTHSLKKSLDDFICKDVPNKLAVVFCAHDPFLAAAAYAKKRDSRIKICFIVPDLPQYMNLESKRSLAYDFFKLIDIKFIEQHIKYVDSAVVLTREMIPKLGMNNIPCEVVEGVIEETKPIVNRKNIEKSNDIINIVYAGKLYEKFGIKNLVDAFSMLSDSKYRLVLCGNGDAVDYINKKAKADKRIVYKGQLSPEQVEKHISEADILVNPRTNDEIYTRYSFPSKNIEYLLSGKPLVAYMLDGMPEYYRNFIYEIDANIEPIQAIKQALETVICADNLEIKQKYMSFYKYAQEHLTAKSVAEKIIRLSEF